MKYFKCSKCHKYKLIKYFYKAKEETIGHRYDCIVCNNKMTRAGHYKHRTERLKRLKARYRRDLKAFLLYARNYRRRNKIFFTIYERPIKIHPSKRICPKCKLVRVEEEFNTDPMSITGRQSYCKYCRANSVIAWRGKHRIFSNINCMLRRKGRYSNPKINLIINDERRKFQDAIRKQLGM